MAEFQYEESDNAATSGQGHFLNKPFNEYIFFHDSDELRCNGFLADPPPHNAAYFSDQLQAAGNYYHTVSRGKLPYTHTIITNPDSPYGYYQVSMEMEAYAKSDTQLAEFFTEVVGLAKPEIEDYLLTKNLSADEVVFIVFHAGLGQDFSLPSMDPTIYDLKSAYIDEDMMTGVIPVTISGTMVTTGILLPETQNMTYFDVVEDIFGNPRYNTYDLCDIQMGMTGIFTFLLGYELGLPPMFNTDSGDSRVGYFGLMDHGSNNGRGVIPVSPVPWTRSLEETGWTTIEEIHFNDLDTVIRIELSHLTDKTYKVNIAEDEYFLIENRMHYIEPEIDIDSLRRKHKIYSKTRQDSVFGHWFDVVTRKDEIFIRHDLISINPETNVILGFEHYDYGLPGSGILIWHVKEPSTFLYSEGINNDVDNPHVKIMEADGAQDIGRKSYAFFASDDPTSGTRWDFWYKGNAGYEFANPGTEEVIFDAHSSPSTRSFQGGESYLALEILSDIGTVMEVRISKDEIFETEYLSQEKITYLGNGFRNADSTAVIFYTLGDSIYKHGSSNEIEALPELFNSNLEYFSFEDSLFSGPIDYFYIDTVGVHHNNDHPSMGYFTQIETGEQVEEVNITPTDSMSFGDVDGDGLDEILTINEGSLIALNANKTLVNGFPVNGEFNGTPLIVNILEDDTPEIILREHSDIVILSANGERLYQLAAYAPDQPLAFIPYWKGKMALVDGSRILLFEQDLDHSYWLNAKSRASGFPLSTGVHSMPDNTRRIRKKAYNYPNPITEGNTTFRFYAGSESVTEVVVKIFDAAGYLVKEDLMTQAVTPFEFNEIIWDNIQLPPGLYLAEVKPNVGKAELVRMVITK
ncbi:MAG: hypothetical protein QGF57_07165 [Candidatus Marinimicrobia bacterium]|nr:hypothetical protein [Candidatus Neomarinimicrobiota bacterium]